MDNDMTEMGLFHTALSPTTYARRWLMGRKARWWALPFVIALIAMQSQFGIVVALCLVAVFLIAIIAPPAKPDTRTRSMSTTMKGNEDSQPAISA